MYKDIKEIIDLMITGNSSIWIIVSIIFVLWLYKEIRNKYVKNYDFETSRIDKILEVYGLIEISVKKNLKCENEENKEEMYKLFSLNYAYISRNLYLSWDKFILSPNQKKMNEILEKLRSEISTLNYEQTNRIDIIKKDPIEYYSRSLKPFFTPMLITILTIGLLLATFTFTIYVMDPQNIWYKKLDIIFVAASVYLFLLFLYVFISLLLEKKMMHNIKNWCLTLVTVIGMTLVLNTQFFSVIYLPWIIYYLFVYFNKIQKKKEYTIY